MRAQALFVSFITRKGNWRVALAIKDRAAPRPVSKGPVLPSHVSAKSLLPITMLFLLAALAFTAVWPSATALKNLTSTGCADASGFQTCQDAANTKISACLSQTAGSTEEEEGCACEDYILNYNCYATHCWNRVWECDYQEYMASYMLNCPTAKFPVPYFPAEDGVPDACSCNLGKVYQAITDAIDQGATCLKHANSDFNTVEFGACQCCEISGAMSGQVVPSRLHTTCVWLW